jgi:hypothetical protein
LPDPYDGHLNARYQNSGGFYLLTPKRYYLSLHPTQILILLANITPPQRCFEALYFMKLCLLGGSIATGIDHYCDLMQIPFLGLLYVSAQT